MSQRHQYQWEAAAMKAFDILKLIWQDAIYRSVFSFISFRPFKMLKIKTKNEELHQTAVEHVNQHWVFRTGL